MMKIYNARLTNPPHTTFETDRVQYYLDRRFYYRYHRMMKDIHCFFSSCRYGVAVTISSIVEQDANTNNMIVQTGGKIIFFIL